VHDFSTLGVDLPSGDDATVAGLVLDRRGRVPDGPGETIELEGWALEVVEVTGHAIAAVRIRPSPRSVPTPTRTRAK
jgi:magnesium and cobalt exporter, CNNM family